MRLARLRIVNFRRFKHVDVEVPDGIIGLVGRNGAGKSTLLEAIGWCLYGHDAARTGKDLIKRRGCLPTDDVSVTLAFHFGGHTYEVTRELLGKSGSHVASVAVDGAVLVHAGAQSQKEATEYVSRLFHMDRDAFFTSLVARQRELSALSDAKPSERKRILLSLLRIDAVDHAIQSARLERRDARKELDGLRAAMLELDPLRKRLEETDATLAKAGEDSLALETRVRDLEESLETRRAARDESRRRADAHRQVASEVAVARSRVEDAKRDVGRTSLEMEGVQRAAGEAAKLAPALEALPAAKARVEKLTAMRVRHEELLRVRAELQGVEGEEKAAREEIDALARQTADAEALRAQAQAFPQERATLEQALQSAQVAREHLASLRLRHEEAARTRRLAEEAENEAKAAQAEAEASRLALGTANAVRRLAKRLPEERARQEEGASKAQQEAAAHAARAQEVERVLRELERTTQRVRELGPDSPCPTCTRPLHEHYDVLLAQFDADAQRHQETLSATAPALEAARAQEQEARQRLAELAERDMELREKLSNLVREETRLHAAEERARQALARAQQARERVAELVAEPFDEERLAQAQKAETQAREALRALSAREAQLNERVARLARDEARLEAARRRAQEAAVRAARLRDQAAAMAGEPFDPEMLTEASRALSELEQLRDRHARLMAVADRLGEVQLVLGEAREREAGALKVLQDAQSRLTAIAFDAAAHEAVERAAEEAEARLQEARLGRERLRSLVARTQDERQRVVEEVARQESLRVKEGELEGRVRMLERLAGERHGGLLPDFKDHLIGRVRPLVSTHAGRLFRELTDGRYADLELGDDYDLLVHEEGEAFALNRFSGGEGDLANLCLRLAVGQVVAERAGTEGFGFLALDEIFGSQDEVRKGNILRALGSLTGRFRQILLITHIEDVKEAAEHVLRVVAHEDGTSELVLE